MALTKAELADLLFENVGAYSLASATGNFNGFSAATIQLVNK